MHPFAVREDVDVTSDRRYREVEATMRALARREPTMAQHVHVAVPDADSAVRALDGLRGALPVILALSANSPYWHGSDSGFASVRTPVFSMFPRIGIPRRFGRYGEYVATVAAMLRARAIPDPGFLWWDARLQPRLGTVEVRMMDAQSRLLDVAALAALVQCLVRRFAAGGRAYAPPLELLAENRFLAARDGLEAQLLDDRRAGGRRAVRAALAELLEDCAPARGELGCAGELADAAGAGRRPRLRAPAALRASAAARARCSRGSPTSTRTRRAGCSPRGRPRGRQACERGHRRAPLPASAAPRDASAMSTSTSTHTVPDPLAGARSSGWILIAAGAIAIVAGLLAIAYPDITLLALAIFAGINLIVVGLMSVIEAFDDEIDSGARALAAVLGILGMIAGLVVLRRPGESLLALLLVLGIWLDHLGRGLVLPLLPEPRRPRPADARRARGDRARRADPRRCPTCRCARSPCWPGSASCSGACWRSTPASSCASCTPEPRQPDAARIEAGKIRECTT